mmetsp:Transcript_15518/g.23005  ORF Transcript_15518/g.23005 Transcript_15518/m.23005 type:complete len:101 (-) Transcript_15518:745-1047(-)
MVNPIAKIIVIPPRDSPLAPFLVRPSHNSQDDASEVICLLDTQKATAAMAAIATTAAAILLNWCETNPLSISITDECVFLVFIIFCTSDGNDDSPFFSSL